MSKYRQFLPIILILILAVIWGSSFILMKNGLKAFSAAQVATMRMFFSFLFLLPLSFINFRKVPVRKLGMVSLVGLLGNGLPAILFAFAQTKLNSSTAGVLNSLTPIFTLVISFVFFKQHFSTQKVLGIILGLVGAVVLILLRGNGSIDPNFTYGLYILVATICYAWSVNLIKYYLQDIPSMAISSMVLIFIGPLFGWYLFAQTDFMEIAFIPGNQDAFISIIILSLFGTAISLILFNMLVKLTTPVYASSVTYLIPIVALSWGLMDGENLGIVHIIGIAAILTGVYLANRKSRVPK